MQTFAQLFFHVFFSTGISGEEDCLTLDIYTSSVLYDTRAPVVIYVPGDAEELMPSAALASQQAVVFVVVNVRQGALGFLSHALLSGRAFQKHTCFMLAKFLNYFLCVLKK
jgi:carboxylesterase type B